MQYITLHSFVQYIILHSFVQYITLHSFVQYITLHSFVQYITLHSLHTLQAHVDHMLGQFHGPAGLVGFKHWILSTMILIVILNP